MKIRYPDLRNCNIDSKIQIKGRISLKLSYNKNTSNLDINSIKCQDLAVANIKNKWSDPYVKLYNLLEKNKPDKRKTSVVRKSLNPEFKDEGYRVIIIFIIECTTIFFHC